MLKGFVCVGVVMGSVIGLSGSVGAVVLEVPDDYVTIQAGIDAALDGDTVAVASGVYTGDGNRDIDFLLKAIVVMSKDGPLVTTINCGGRSFDPHRAFIFTRGEGPESEVRGFTIKNGWWPGPGGAIRCALASSPTIAGNVIVQNVAYTGGAICCSASHPDIESNTFSGNKAYEGGAIACMYHSFPTINNCIAWKDTAGEGSEIYVDSSSDPVVTFSDVEGGWSGVTNIDLDPLFVRTGKRDHRLLWPSPCVDAGPTTTLDPDSTRSDMGALFFDQSKELVVYATPESQQAVRGERWRAVYTVINCHEEERVCWGIVDLQMPEGMPWPWNPVDGPLLLVVPPQSYKQAVRRYDVPATAPLGTWQVIAKVGYPGDRYDRDSVRLTVIEP